MDWFLYDRDLRNERAKQLLILECHKFFVKALFNKYPSRGLPISKKALPKLGKHLTKLDLLILYHLHFILYPPFPLVFAQQILVYTARKMKFSIKDFFSSCEPIRRSLRTLSHLRKRSIN